jgi:hypothetical protein
LALVRRFALRPEGRHESSVRVAVSPSAPRAVRNRIRRLLPALWVIGLIAVPLMIQRGWPDRPSWPHLLLWAFPIADPPASEFGFPAAGVLWHLISPLPARRPVPADAGIPEPVAA